MGVLRKRPQPMKDKQHNRPRMSEHKASEVIHGDSEQELRRFATNSFDSVVTDPPYGLSKEPNITEVLTKWIAGDPYDHKHGGFMGKSWDSFVPHPNLWKEVYRVLKPGGYALVFAGTRTQDLMTIALRLAGFEVRDVIEWLYFTGFPKSMDVSKAFDKRDGAEREVVGQSRWFGRNPNGRKVAGQNRNYGVDPRTDEQCNVVTAPATDLAKHWDGWGTALKPAHEPIIVVRKPLIGTVAENVETFGTGAINIDGCRIGMGSGNEKPVCKANGKNKAHTKNMGGGDWANVNGRFPANIVTVEQDGFFSTYCNVTPQELSKKAGKKDRNSDWQGNEIAVETIQPVRFASVSGSGKMLPSKKSELESHLVKGNFHPTVKPIPLMRWLLKLVTPPNGKVLDPFAGSGSTLVAAGIEGFDAVGIDTESEYVEITKARTGGAEQ